MAKYISYALKFVSVLIISINDENEPVAFMGIEEKKLEMPFVLV